MKNSKTIIGFINTTLRGYRIALKEELTEEKAKKIILAIIGDLPISEKVTKEVVFYCNQNYNTNF